VEVRLNFRCNRWIPIGGRLTLVNLVLKAIQVFWYLMTSILKGVLERKTCFNFLLFGKKETEIIPPVKREIIARLKEEGGWGLNNIHIFGSSLETKSL
jgi:hypothetical protein